MPFVKAMHTSGNRKTHWQLHTRHRLKSCFYSPPRLMMVGDPQTHFGGVADTSSHTSSSLPTDDEDDLETPKASMFLSQHCNLPTTTSSATISGGAHPTSPRSGISRRNSSLSIREDYFPPSPSSLPIKQRTHSQQHHHHQQLSSNAGLAS